MIFFLALLAIAAASKDQLVNLAANDPKLMVALFNDFVRTEGRVFETPTEARMRMRNFNDFVKMTAKWNAEDEDVDYGITTFADWTEAEYEGTLGFNSTGMPSAPAPIDEDVGPAPLGEAPASSPTTEPSRTRDEPTPVGHSPEPLCARVSTESSDLEDTFLSRKPPTVPVAPPLPTEDSITKLSKLPSPGTISLP